MAYIAGDAEQGGRRGDCPQKFSSMYNLDVNITLFVLLYKVFPLNGRVPEPPLYCRDQEQSCYVEAKPE